MNNRKVTFLTLLLFYVLQYTYAQLPIRNTVWKGEALPANPLQTQLRFREDTLFITTETNDTRPEIMRYAQTGDTILIQKIAGQSACGLTDTGVYRVLYSNNGEVLQLQPITDACPDRQRALPTNRPFIRVRPAGQPPRNWPYLDPVQDSVAGISLYRAYDLLKGRPSVPVVVGVLDSGVDLTHEDLKDVAWINPKELPANAIDDDKNGYTDDLNGWNFMGAPDGTTYEYDQPEIAQTYLLLKTKYDPLNPANITPAQQRQYATYQTAKKQFLQRYRASRPTYLALTDTVTFWQVTRKIQAELPDTTLAQSAIRAVDVSSDSIALAVRTILANAYNPQYGSFSTYVNLIRKNWESFKRVTGGEALIGFNPDYNPRKTVGDNPADPTERYYGSPRMVLGQSQQLAMHGSHVAGIIGAKRGNGLGIDGVADNVRIMPVSVVPANGDERDKDVANGIRYAVENGARVINMSFGKRLSPFKEQIDAAIRFAEDNDVLLVHAAGNNGENHDSLPSYPSARYENGQLAQNVLVVGNSTWQLNETLPSRSSNYGVQSVDIFAPGTDILSTLPGNRYASFSGTSMAAPMTAGVAALLRSYFPKLTAVQVKEILMKSAYKSVGTVRKPGRTAQNVPFSTLSRSGGLLNAHEAVKMAMSK